MAVYNIKPGVDASNLSPQIEAGIQTAERIYQKYGQPFTLTSGREGQHVTNSKHYTGNAGDTRTRDLDPRYRPQILSELRGELGSDYTVIDEGDHFHIQYNKGGGASGSTPVIGTPPIFAPQVDWGGFDLSKIFEPTVEDYQDVEEFQTASTFAGLSMTALVIGIVGLLVVAKIVKG